MAKKETVTVEKKIHNQIRELLENVWTSDQIAISDICVDWINVFGGGKVDMLIDTIKVQTVTKPC